MNVKFERKRPIIKAEIGQQRKQYKNIKILELKNYNKITTKLKQIIKRMLKKKLK